MKIAVAQLGARRHYAVPRILHEAGMLERLFTDAYIGNKPWLESSLRGFPRHLRVPGFDRWLGRKDHVLPPDKVTSFDLFGINYQRRLRRASGTAAVQCVFLWAGSEFGSRVTHYGFGDADHVWGFNSASLEIFRAAKSDGLRCILEQTIAPLPMMNRLLGAELERWPDWQPDLELAGEVTEHDLRRAAEWELADLIICGSQFVVDGIAECDGPVEKCRIVPYGVDLERFRTKEPRRRPPGDRLRVLFAGEVGLRKGAPYLLEALRCLGTDRIEARCAGKISIEANKVESYRDIVTFLGVVPRSRMLEHFAWADVFVLPSICEGSAIVIYEAVALKLPVICTPNAGALSSGAVTIVPAGDIQALAAALELHHAQTTAPAPISDAERMEYGIAAYRSRLLATLRALDSKQVPAAVSRDRGSGRSSSISDDPTSVVDL